VDGTANSGAVHNRAAAGGSGGGDGEGVGAASRLSIEPWLANGVVQEKVGEDGSRALVRGRGSSKRRSSGVGGGVASTPLAVASPGRGSSSPFVEQPGKGGEGTPRRSPSVSRNPGGDLQGVVSGGDGGDVPKASAEIASGVRATASSPIGGGAKEGGEGAGGGMSGELQNGRMSTGNRGEASFAVILKKQPQKLAR